MSYGYDDDHGYEGPVREGDYLAALELVGKLKAAESVAELTGDLEQIKAAVNALLAALPKSIKRFCHLRRGFKEYTPVWEELAEQLAECTEENFGDITGQARAEAVYEYFADHPSITDARETVENYDDGYEADVRFTYYANCI